MSNNGFFVIFLLLNQQGMTMYQFKTEIRNLNRYSKLGRIIYNGPANTYYNGQNLKVALLVYERRNSLRCNDWNYAVKVRAKLKGKKAGVFDGPLLNGVNMASIHASIPSIIDYWKAAPMYAECF